VPRISKKSKLRELVKERGWSRIGEAEWEAVCAAIPNIGPEDLQQLDVPVDAPWCGVRQHTFAELAESLCALTYGIFAVAPSFAQRTAHARSTNPKWWTGCLSG
jgi:hypothetical protein